jgi:DNA-binding transcriptional ArsR family regulator
MSFTPQHPRLVSPDALRALGHPTRLRILGHLQLRGHATATECAEEVGESPSSCSYHLRTLARHGFVTETPSEDGRERRWRAQVSGYEFPSGAEESEELQAASALARAALLEVEDDAVREYLRSERLFAPEWRDAATFTLTTISATPAELVEIDRAIRELLAPFAPGARTRSPRSARLVSVGVRAVPQV